MDKTELRNFAIYSREKLIKDIKNKAKLIGITEEGIKSPLLQSNADMKIFDIGETETYRISGKDVSKYNKLIDELKKREKESEYKTAYKTLVEEVAYTWFNRIIAIRFMEVNNYMPDKMRILSSGKKGVREPEFVTYYRDTDIEITGEEFEKLDELKLDGSAGAMEEFFQFMFIKQCNALNKNLPKLFEKTDDYAELLLTISYNDPEGVIYKLIEDIGEEPFDIEKTGQIEIIGWMYQYYNIEPKAEVDASKKKVDKNTLPAKTQLFTPEWIVKYMVQNSLGRLWIERKIAIGTDKMEEQLAEEYGWEYYLPEAQQIKEVEIELKNIREDRKHLKVEDITFIDPSMGSGHVFVYAFEMFMQFYLEEGYMEREAAENIIKNNLYGLDIDKRAYQLAYFALMMKGRQHNRRILDKEIKNNLCCFIDSKDINIKQIDFLGGNIKDEKDKKNIKKDILEIIKLFKDGRELGSIIKIDEEHDYDKLIKFVQNINDKGVLPIELMGIENIQKNLIHIIRLTEMLSNKYDVVVTNPPYLGRKHMGVNLTEYLDKEYKDIKADLFAAFMEMGLKMTKSSSFMSMVTMQSWMFLSSYKKARENLLNNKTIVNLIHMENMVMRIAFGTSATVFYKGNIKGYRGTYNQIMLKDIENEFPKNFPIKENRYNQISKDNFELIPGSPIAYWANKKIGMIFKKNNIIGNIYEAKQGMTTADNKRFLRYWYETNYNKIGYGYKDTIEAKNSKKKWFPYNKGGAYKKWFGNNDYVVNYENDGFEMKEFTSKLPQGTWVRLKSREYYFRESITWTFISSSKFGVRYSPQGFIFDVAGSSLFSKDKLNYLLGFLSTKVAFNFLQIVNPTLNYQIKDIKSLPIVICQKNEGNVNLLAQQNILISKIDWDSFETSWDFEIHPLLDKDKQGQVPKTIESAYKNWKEYANNNFVKLKENEERLNKLFIEIYSLEDELTPEISDKDITIAKIFDDREDIYEDIKGNVYILIKEDVIKSFISYGVGCIFGRYSLDEKGLVYAGGEFDICRYKKFKPTGDNVAVITDKEYFEDDLINRFVEFVKVSFGAENLEENLKFIAGSLKGKGTSKEKIRNYFVNDFYKDHVQMYKKTPIYWLYDSSAGKTRRQSQNGFKALIYMHRYDEDTTGKVRIDYLHKVQKVYENRMDFLRDDIANNKDSREVAKSEKELEKIVKQLKECKDYDVKIGHIALSRIGIDLDDGVKVNYEKAQTDNKEKKYEILTKI